MGNRATGRWGALLAASFAVHTALLVNSTETALWNEQNREGVILSQQLADAAAPLTLSRDMVSLSVLVGRYENRPGITGVRLFNARGELIAEAGSPLDNGRLFTSPIRLQQQSLGQVELRLEQASRGDILRANLGNIGLSALLHFLVFLGGLLLSRTAPAQPEARTAAATASRAPAPSASPVPLADTAVTLLHLALDDPNGLLTRVNASTANELLGLLDQFVDRAAQLYGGEVAAPFSPEGVLVTFHQPDAGEREFQALAAAALFLRLIEDSAEERRQQGRLCLAAKAGVLQTGGSAEVAAILAHTAPSGRILSTQPQTLLGARCRLGTSFQLAVQPGQTLTVALLEELAPEYRQLINNQSQQILSPPTSDEA